MSEGFLWRLDLIWFFCLLYRSMCRNSNAHIHWFYIAQTQKNSILQMAISEDWYLPSEYQTIHSTLSHTFYLLPLRPYPNNTIKRPPHPCVLLLTTHTLFLSSFCISSCIWICWIKRHYINSEFSLLFHHLQQDQGI